MSTDITTHEPADSRIAAPYEAGAVFSADAPSMGSLTIEDDVALQTGERLMTLNMGPQHPSTHGVLRVVLKLDGELIIDCDPVIGYLHRGTEKLGEHHRYAQVIPWTDRTDYVAAPMNNLGCVLAIEKLCGVDRAGARAVLARDHVGAGAHRLPPGLARHARPRHRRALDVALLLPRARADPRHLRGVLRRPADDEHDGDRRVLAPDPRKSARAWSATS